MEGDLCQDQLQPASNRFVSVSFLLSVLYSVYCVLCTGPSSLLPVIPPSLPAPAFPASSHQSRPGPHTVTLSLLLSGAGK